MAIQSDLVIKGLIDIALKGDGSKQAVDSLRRIIAETEKLDAEQRKQLQTAKASEVIERAKGTTARQSAAAQVDASARVTAAKKKEEAAGREAAAAQIKGNQQVLASARALYSFLATGALVAFVKSSLTEYAKTERAFNSLTAQIRALGGAAAAEGANVREFIDELSRQSGILDEELIPAMNQAVLRFRNYASAQDAVTLAAKFAANGLGTVEGNVEKLASAIQTGTGRGLDDFGVTLKKTAAGSVDLADAINQVRTAAGRLPDNLNDAQTRVGAFARVVSDAKRAVGEFFDTLAFGYQQSKLTVEEWKKMSDFKIKVPTFEVTVPKGKDPLVEQAEQRQKEIDAAHDAARAKEIAAEEEAARKASEAWLAERAHGWALEMEASVDAMRERHAQELAAEMEQARRLIDVRMGELEKQKQLAIEAGDAQAELDAALFEERLASVKENSEQYTALLLEEIDNEEQAKLQALENEKAALVSLAVLKLTTAEEVAAKLAIIEKKITTAQINASTARKAIIEAEAATQQMAYASAAQNIVTALETMFGESKAFSIAQALINTYQGITLALASIPPPASFAVAASIGAMGFAQVAKIMSTRPGSGGGGEAGLGGGAAIPAPPPPVSQGQQAAAAGTINNVTNNQATTQNVSMGYPVRNKIEARRMARRLNRLGTADPKRAW